MDGVAPTMHDGPLPDERPVFFTPGTDARLAGGWTQVPNVVLRSPRLTAGAKVLYGILLSYAWQSNSCYPDQTTLAHDAGCSERNVRRWLAELEDARLIRIHQRGLNRPNIYEILPLTGWEGTTSPDRTSMSGPERTFTPDPTPLAVPDRTALSDPDRTSVSGPDRTSVSAEEDSREEDSELKAAAAAPSPNPSPAAGQAAAAGGGVAMEPHESALPLGADTLAFLREHLPWMLTPSAVFELSRYADLPEPVVLAALEEGRRHRARSIRYVLAILERARALGITDPADLHPAEPARKATRVDPDAEWLLKTPLPPPDERARQAERIRALRAMIQQRPASRGALEGQTHVRDGSPTMPAPHHPPGESVVDDHEPSQLGPILRQIVRPLPRTAAGEPAAD